MNRHPRSLIRELWSLVTFVVVVASAGACHRPVPGEPCAELGSGSCIDGGHSLRCRDYSWHIDPCRGAGGCAPAAPATARAVTCDASVADEGDTCGQRGQTACTSDRNGLVACNGRAFVRVSSCRGPGACVAAAAGATCDTRSAREGDPCVDPLTAPFAAAALVTAVPHAPEGGSHAGGFARGPRATACTHDAEGDAELVCTDGVFVLHERCRGTGGCSIASAGIVCDDSIAELGDPCHALNPVCSTDGRSALNCSDSMNGRYVRFATCRGAAGCLRALPVGQFECDQTLAEVGDPCGPPGTEACTADGKHLLGCAGRGGRSCGTSRRYTSYGYAVSGPVASGVMSELLACKHRCRIDQTKEGSRVDTTVDCK